MVKCRQHDAYEGCWAGCACIGHACWRKIGRDCSLTSQQHRGIQWLLVTPSPAPACPPAAINALSKPAVFWGTPRPLSILLIQAVALSDLTCPQLPKPFVSRGAYVAFGQQGSGRGNGGPQYNPHAVNNMINGAMHSMAGLTMHQQPMMSMG